MITLGVDFVTETCCHKGCNLTFAFTDDFYRRVRNDSSIWWYCPAGHSQHYTGKSDAQKLADAKAREVALQDQLAAAIREGEATRAQLLRDRQRFANGVCPCCNRTFANVRDHMHAKHPEYVDSVAVKPLAYRCSCGRKFESYRGLRTHQGWQRQSVGQYAWDKPGQSRWYAHLTEVGAS